MAEGSFLVGRTWRKILPGYGWMLTFVCRPKEFVKQSAQVSSDEEDSRVGKMPSSDESDA